jgi:hypothetical protein
LLTEEANFVKDRGWSLFEDVLELENPDLMDLNRGSIVKETLKKIFKLGRMPDLNPQHG